jgi:hypothetical protein
VIVSIPRSRRYNKRYILVISAPYAFELVENAVIFVEVTKFASQMVMDWNGLDGPGFHVNIPDLQREIITRENIATVVTELDVRYR